MEECAENTRCSGLFIKSYLRNLTDQALKWELADQQLGRPLVLADLAKGDGAWAVASWWQPPRRSALRLRSFCFLFYSRLRIPPQLTLKPPQRSRPRQGLHARHRSPSKKCTKGYPLANYSVHGMPFSSSPSFPMCSFSSWRAQRTLHEKTTQLTNARLLVRLRLQKKEAGPEPRRSPGIPLLEV